MTCTSSSLAIGNERRGSGVQRGMQALPQGVLGIITTHGFKAGEDIGQLLFESALRLARATEDGEARILMGGRALLCITCGSAGVLIASATDGHATWSARRRANALIRRPMAYARVNGQS
jgi:hypothetical protein